MRSELVALGEVCDITMGQAPKGDTYNDDGVGWPLIAGAGDFGELHPAIHKFTTAADARLCEPGDFVLGIRASIGEKVLADAVYCLGRGVAGLRPRPALHDRYLWHWISYASHELAQRGRGATFKQVNKSDVNSWKIPLPPIEEQRRIASVLDAADALRAKRRQALAKLDDLIRAVFVDMFGTDMEATLPAVPFGNLLLKPLRNGISPSRTGSVQGDVLTLSAITGSTFEHAACKRSTFNKAHEDEKTVRRGDFLICRGNGNLQLVGRGSHPDRDMPHVAFPDTMIAASCNPELISRAYLAHIWHHPSIRVQVEGLARTTNGTHKVNQSAIRSLLVPLPHIHCQAQFDDAEQEVAALRDRQASAAQRSDELFGSLQQRAFRGEL